MADIANIEKNHIIIEGPSGTDAIVDADGRFAVGTEGKRATYAAAIAGLVSAATATDIFTITESATKTIRILRIIFSISTTTGSGLSFTAQLIKRSTANSGGTSTSPTVVAHDSNDAAGTAVVRAYTANPTLGTTVGSIRAERTEAAPQGITRDRVVWDFGVRNGRAIVLRGTSEVLAVNFNSTTITGPVIGASIEWTEE